LKVLWLIKGLGLGGAEKLLALSAPHVDRSRYEVEVAYLLPWKNALVPDLERAGVRVTCLNHARPFDLRVVPRIARFLRQRKIDLLHAHLPYSGIVGRVAARAAGVPYVLYTEHNVQERYHPLTRIANQLTMRMCNLTIAVSEGVRESLLRSPLVPGARVRTILNGVDVEGLRRAAGAGPDVRTELGIPRDRRVVGVVNVFRPQKRIDLWIQAARKIADADPQAVFVLVGDGPILPEMRVLADSVGLGRRITFAGLRPDAPRLIAAFDVFMLASDFEGLPVAVLEAMALGKPVVATDAGGLPGVIADGTHGFLVERGAPAALAGKVLSLLSDPSLRRSMGDASARRVLEHFSIQRMVRETEDAYESLLSRPGARRRSSLEPGGAGRSAGRGSA
jgi:glycosyltransferase involved in cell wall biosynthesis